MNVLKCVFFETLLKAVMAAKLIQNPALTPSFKWFEPLTLMGLEREIATHKLCAMKTFFQLQHKNVGDGAATARLQCKLSCFCSCRERKTCTSSSLSRRYN